MNYLHFTLTGEEMALNIPPAGAYLDAVIGGRELWPGDTPRLGSAIEGRFICCVAIEGFPQESFPESSMPWTTCRSPSAGPRA